MAYEESTYKYQGQWSAQLRDMVAAGSILKLDLRGGCFETENARELAKALQSETCRVTELKCAPNTARLPIRAQTNAALAGSATTLDPTVRGHLHQRWIRWSD